MFLPTRLLKTMHGLLAFALILQPILMAVPIPAYAREVAHAAPAETTPVVAAGPAYPAAAPAGPLVVREPVESDVLATTAQNAAVPGQLDATFGGNGIVTTDLGVWDAQWACVAIQPDGKIVAAGTVQNGDGDFDTSFAVARYNTDGTLDTTFDIDGIAITTFQPGYNVAHAIAIQQDGKIIVAGDYMSPQDSSFMVVRYNTDGTLDTSFGVDGIVTTSAGEKANAVAFQSNGKIVVAGSSSNEDGDRAIVVRYNANGSLDTFFGSGGIAITDIEETNNITSIAIQPDGKIVAGGEKDLLNSGGQFILYRYTPYGRLDTTFGTNGIVTTDFNPGGVSSTAGIEAIVLQGDGKIIAVGPCGGYAESYDIALARYNTDGALDASFGTNGTVITDFGTALWVWPRDIVLQSDDKILIAGIVADFVNDSDIMVSRYNSDGSLDTTFANSGIVTTDVNSVYDGAHGIALQSDGKLVVAGYAEGDLALARYHTGSPANEYVSNTWTWVSGSDVADQPSVYGTKGIPHPANVPGARMSSVTWTDTRGHLWLFGGGDSNNVGWIVPTMNDLWEYDGGNWTWVSGTDIKDQPGIYEDGDPSKNMPGARWESASWIDAEGNLWLFGGEGKDSRNPPPALSYPYLNDLWKFNRDNLTWTWVSGSKIGGQRGIYGSKGVAHPNNVPGARTGSVSWMDAKGHFWLFGGRGCDNSGPCSVSLNDLWKYDGVNWMWVSGSGVGEQPGVYEDSDPSENVPGARYNSVSWTDAEGHFWLFGGLGFDSVGHEGLLDDLWKYDGVNWTWVSGSKIADQPANYGAKGVPSSINTPGSRFDSVSWVDAMGHLWLFGGLGTVNDDSPPGGRCELNDLWKYDGENWTWVSGWNGCAQIGVYGTKKMPSLYNVPGARLFGSVSWMDVEDHFWLFGGLGFDSTGDESFLNDLWQYDLSGSGIQPFPPLPSGQTAGVREADYNFDNYGAYTQGQVGADPINTRTGKLTDYEVDLSIPTLAGALSFERSYSSVNARAVADGDLAAGALSPGWNHNYEVHLILPTAPDTRVELYTAGGNRLGFTDNGDGTFDPEPGVGGTLTYNATAGEFVYRSTADIGYTFDEEGVLQRIDDGMGHELILRYDAAGLLTEVYSPDSLRALFFGYNDEDPPQLDEVRTAVVQSDGTWVSDLAQSVSFTYSPGGDLATVTDVNEDIWGYEYEDPDHPHFLTARIDPNDDLLVAIEYDDDGRAEREFNNAGETLVELTYTANDVTTIDYGQNGVGGSVIHEYSTGGVLRLVTDGAGGVTEYGYDPDNFRASSVIDPNNNETTMTWSDDGADLEIVEDAEGNETTTTVDDRHNPTLVTNPDETQTRFVYNGDGSATNPLTGSPIGNSAWDEDVLLLRIDNYVDGSSALDANRVTSYEYNGQSLLVEVTRPDGTATCTTYTDILDASPAGLPEKVTENCTSDPNVPGAHAITTYTYDALGRVETATDPIERVTLYRYFDDDDLADEVISNYDGSDLNNANNYYKGGVYNLSTRTYRDKLGRAYATVANYYNPFGESLTADEIGAGLLIGRNLVDRVYFDAAGRVETRVTNFVDDLVEGDTTPPSFDPASPDRNLVTRTVYDGAGRVVATIDNYYRGDASQSFDLNGDAVGGVVTLEISTTETQYNQITRITYDAAGRVQTTTAAAWPEQQPFYHPPSYQQRTYNLVSANAYDLAGNVIASISNYDPTLTDGNSNALTASIALSPDEAPVTLIIDPDTPDRNVIACATYDEINRPYLTRSACVPGNPTDYLERDGGLYNLPTRAYYDEMGRVYATVDNYERAPGGDLILTTERNFITRTYYDGLGRVTATVANYNVEVFDLDDQTLPDYNPGLPDYNLITRILYDNRGYPVATIYNPEAAGDLPTQAEVAGSASDVNLVTVTHYNAIGQPDWTAANYVGEIDELLDIPADAGPPAFVPPAWNLVSKAAYDELGRQVEATITRDAGSEPRVARTTLDDLGRTTQTVLNYQPGAPAAPDINVTTGMAYGNLGRIVTVTGPTGQSQRTKTDALGRVTDSIIDPADLALTTTTEYDAAGRPVRTVTENEEDDLPADRVTTARYDALGQTIETIADPDGPAPISTSATYDLLGRVVEAIDPMGTITRSYYDNLGRLQKTFQNFTGGAPACNQEPNVATDANVCTSYTYDDAGHVKSTTLGNGSTTEYTYDALGRVT
ncbi:MAG: hypothetical protein JXR84_21605, partial [Anaerolineae bacterium]|nr:hypothetical protein [Anaerolineae bacterium]